MLALLGVPRRAVSRGAQADGEGIKPPMFGVIKIIKPNGGVVSPVSLRIFSPSG